MESGRCRIDLKALITFSTLATTAHAYKSGFLLRATSGAPSRAIWPSVTFGSSAEPQQWHTPVLRREHSSRTQGVSRLHQSTSDSAGDVAGPRPNIEAQDVNKEESVPPKSGGRVKGYPAAIYKFTRPHTIRGTILASITGVARALLEVQRGVSWELVPRAILGLVALLLGNAYIVGINQIYDVDIDKINKPELPVASGEMSKRLAWVVVVGSATIGPFIVRKAFSPLIFRLYSFGLLVGGLYSVPPFQLKRFAVLAGLTIACVRGFLLNFGVYYAVREALGLPFKWNPAVLFLARFMTVFAGVIAVTKDLPDVKGDREYNISTFASVKGVNFTSRIACVVLGLNYLLAIAQGALSPEGSFNKRVMIGAHSALLFGLARSLQQLDPDSQDSVKSFYKRIWDLFYLEYAIYPFL